MSLQVWLPLDYHLKNQGLSSVQFNSGDVVYDYGKIGYCAKSGTITGTANDLSSTSGFTYGLWMKIPSGTVNAEIIRIPINNGTKDTALHAYKMNYDAVKIHEASNDPQMIWDYTGKWSYDKWFHYVITVQSKDAGIVVTSYIDGQVATTYTNANYNFTLIPGQIRLSNAIFKNDFRIYDHVLSKKEIEEWSRGLFLHYPLRDTTLQASVNLLPHAVKTGTYTNGTWNASLHPDAISVNGWSVGYNGGVGSAEKGYHAYWKMIDDVPTIVFQDLNSTQGAGAHRWLGVSAAGTTNLATAIGANTTYTISFEARADRDGMRVNTGLHYAKEGTTTRAFNDGTKTINISTKWKKYSWTWTMGSSVNTSVAPSVYMYGHNSSIEGIIYVRRMQLEVSNHATDYVAGTRIVNQVEDCSGFEHHGTIIGSVQMLPDSARNEYSCFETDGRYNYVKSNNMVFPKDQITMCCWVKGSDTGYSNYHIPLSFNSSAYEMSLMGPTGKFRGGFHVNGSRVCEDSSRTSIDGTWHFLAITYDGTTVRKYVDAIESTPSLSASGSLSGGVGNLLVGNYNGTTYGNKNLYTSDVRIYATALSQEALQEIKSIGATIDNYGTLYGYEFVEKDSNSIFKEGLVDFSEIIEHNINRFKYYDGELWAQILHHNNKAGKVLFTKETADNYTSEDLYSRLYLIEELRGDDGKFEFMALQPDSEPGKVYRWKQSNNPNVTTTGSGFENIANMSGALVKCSGNTHWAISNSTGNWWNAVGCYTAYSGGIPGFGKVVPTGTLDVYVKVSKRSSILADAIEAYNLYEF